MNRRARAAPSALRAGASSAPGSRRQVNEDAHVAGPVWFAVADGMGGHLAGDVASALAIETLRAAGPVASPDAVRRTVATANEAIRARALADGTPGMGATLVAAVRLEGDERAVTIAHVGDARCYRLDRGHLRLVTRDHTYVQELVDAGRLTPTDAATHALRSVVTRALGADPAVEPDLVRLDRPGRLLLCSDGVSGALDPRRIGRVLAGFEAPQACADRLVELAVRGTAGDDATAVVVDTQPFGRVERDRDGPAGAKVSPGDG